MDPSRRHLLLACFITLAALVDFSEEHVIRNERSIGLETILQFKNKVKEGVARGLNAFLPKPETTPQYNEEQGKEEQGKEEQNLNKGKSRRIITAPIRCPPDHVVVQGRCRLRLR